MVQVVGNGIKPGNPEITDNPVWRALARSITFPTLGEIAWRAGMSEAQVGVALAELEKQGRVTPAQLGNDQERRYKLLPVHNAKDHEPDSGSKQPEVALTAPAVWKAFAFSAEPLTETQIAGKARMTPEEVKAVLDALVEQGLVTPALIGSDPELRYRLLEKYDHDAPAGDLKK
jgi:DNA-binding MarR family transcriptional regulator